MGSSCRQGEGQASPASAASRLIIHPLRSHPCIAPASIALPRLRLSYPASEVTPPKFSRDLASAERNVEQGPAIRCFTAHSAPQGRGDELILRAGGPWRQGQSAVKWR